MSNERDELAELPASQLAFMAALKNETAFKGDGRAFRAGFDAALAWKLPPKPRTVTTAGELNALPVGSVVLDGWGDAYQKDADDDGDVFWGNFEGIIYHFQTFHGPVTLLHEAQA